MRARVFACAVFLVAAVTPLGADEPLTMRLSSSVAFAPATLVIRASVEADPDNRVLAVVAESTDFYRSSEMQLDGDKARRTSVFEFRGLPGGTYEVSAVLIGTRGQRALVRRQINVVARGAAQ